MNEIMPAADTPVAIHQDPEAVLAYAKRCAVALQTVIAGKKKPVIINGEQYLEFEDWQTLAKFSRITVKVERTSPVEIGGVLGWEAHAVVVDENGIEVSAADAMCMSDEDRWTNRPMFQVRSMAQTRACAKALRNVLAWIVVLAGYRPTPAEEMTGDEGRARRASPAPDDTMVVGAVAKIEEKTGSTAKGPWKLTIGTVNGVEYSTFHDTPAKALREAHADKRDVRIEFSRIEKNGRTRLNIEEIQVLRATVDAEVEG